MPEYTVDQLKAFERHVRRRATAVTARRWMKRVQAMASESDELTARLRKDIARYRAMVFDLENRIAALRSHASREARDAMRESCGNVAPTRYFFRCA